LTGTAPTVAADTAYNFTVRATDNESQTTDKAFSLTVADYNIGNSLMFNNDDSAYLSRTPASEGNRDTFTISFWVKRGTIGTRQFIINPWGGSSNDYAQIEFYSTDAIFIQNIVSNSQQLDLRTNRLFRDVSAWYHIVLAVDSTQATASNRAKLYVNGVQETSFSTETYMSQNNDTYFNDNIAHNIGRRGDGSNFFDGYLTEFYLIDGQALTPSSFGETNSNGVWIPKKYTGSYGTNGFALEFDDSSDFGTDTSGNGNDFTANNLAATDQSQDSPHLNYATFNSAVYRSGTLSQGNLRFTTVAGDPSDHGISTFGTNSGKWYAEFKLDTDSTNSMFGVIDEESTLFAAGTNLQVGAANGVGVRDDGNLYTYGSETSSWGTSYTTGDILMIALDMDNGKVYFGKNGTWMNSGDPTSGSTGTGAVSLTNTDRNYFMCVGESFYDATPVWSGNFGSPHYSISSGNSDGDGYGNFEYTVPTGFYALNTKNLATYG